MIVSVIMFFVGIHLMIMMLAATYRITDLWYRIGDFWAGILARISALLLLEGLALNLLTGEMLSSFIWGQVFYLGFHITIFWIARMGIYLIENKKR